MKLKHLFCSPYSICSVESLLYWLHWNDPSPRNHRQGLSHRESQFVQMPGNVICCYRVMGPWVFPFGPNAQWARCCWGQRAVTQWCGCSPVSPIPRFVLPSQHLWKTLCPPEALLLTPLCTELIALINPAEPWAGERCWCWRGDVWCELLHRGRNPTAEGGGKLEHPSATLNLSTDIQPCKWITHSVQLILILHKVGDWSFHSTKWDAGGCNEQQKLESGK